MQFLKAIGRLPRGILFALVPLLATGFISCGSDPVEQEYHELLRVPRGSDRLKLMAQKPYCRQIDIYLHGMNRRPPFILVQYVAANGKNILPVLMDRLEKDPEESNQQALIFVIEVIAMKDPTLKDDEKLVALLRRKVDGMSGFNRQEAEKSLQAILNPRQAKPQ